MSSDTIIRILREIGKRIRNARGEQTFYSECTDLSLTNWNPERFPGVVYGPAVSELIHDELVADRPSMICRLGATELATMTSALTRWRAADFSPMRWRCPSPGAKGGGSSNGRTR